MLTVDIVLEQYPFPASSAECTPLGSAGGMSGAQFWRIDLPTKTLILRRWPHEHPSRTQLRFIHAVLQHASANGCNFLPLPVTTRNGETFVESAGHLWELAPWLPGTADYALHPTPAKLSAAMHALAKFHKATVTFDVGRQSQATLIDAESAVDRHFTRLRDLTPRVLADLAHAIRDDIWPELLPLAHQFLAALPHAIPRAVSQLELLAHTALPLQPCLRDIWHDHVLFTGNEVTGLVDFGAIAIDPPATDIARLVSSFADVTPLPFREGPGEGLATIANRQAFWQHALTAYNQIRPLSENEIRTAYALSTSAPILSGCNWLRWIYLEHREFENHSQVIERFRHIAENLIDAPIKDSESWFPI